MISQLRFSAHNHELYILYKPGIIVIINTLKLLENLTQFPKIPLLIVEEKTSSLIEKFCTIYHFYRFLNPPMLNMDLDYFFDMLVWEGLGPYSDKTFLCLMLTYRMIYILDRTSLKHSMTIEMPLDIHEKLFLFTSLSEIGIIVKNSDLSLQKVILQDLVKKDIKPQLLTTLFNSTNSPQSLMHVDSDWLVLWKAPNVSIYS